MQKDDDGKLVGGTRPILKPPADNQVLDVVSTAKQSAPTKRTEQDPEDAVRYGLHLNLLYSKGRVARSLFPLLFSILD